MKTPARFCFEANLSDAPLPVHMLPTPTGHKSARDLPVFRMRDNNYAKSSPVGVAGQGVPYAVGFGAVAGTLCNLLEKYSA